MLTRVDRIDDATAPYPVRPVGTRSFAWINEHPLLLQILGELTLGLP